MNTNAIVDRLVDEVISVCEPEAGDDVATAHTRKVLTQKFTPLVDSLSRNLAAARTKEMQARGAYKLMENDLAAARRETEEMRERTIEECAALICKQYGKLSPYWMACAAQAIRSLATQPDPHKEESKPERKKDGGDFIAPDDWYRRKP